MSAIVHWTEVTLRPTDRDEVGHVNNVIFATLVAAGRVDFIAARLEPHAAPGTDFWLARIEIDYLCQLRYPGTVRIGTGVERLGRSSIALAHQIEAADGIAARARSPAGAWSCRRRCGKRSPDCGSPDCLRRESMNERHSERGAPFASESTTKSRSAMWSCSAIPIMATRLPLRCDDRVMVS